MFSRTISLYGQNKFEKIRKSHIVLCGCGGVGSYTFEALVRAGIGKITVIDADTISESNINRQIIATLNSVGCRKIDVAIARAKNISNKTEVIGICSFLDKDNTKKLIPENADFIIDAIDFVPAKIEIAKFAKTHNIPFITCLGTGNRLDATKFKICDIYKTSGCPLARKLRYEFKKEKIEKADVLYSDAEIISPNINFNDGKKAVGSVSFVPSVAGLLLAQHAISKITEE